MHGQCASDHLAELELILKVRFGDANRLSLCFGLAFLGGSVDLVSLDEDLNIDLGLKSLIWVGVSVLVGMGKVFRQLVFGINFFRLFEEIWVVESQIDRVVETESCESALLAGTDVQLTS